MVFEMDSVDRVGSLVLEALDVVVRELYRTNDSDGEKILPSVLLTLAVMGLCRQEPPDKVIELLSAMCLKVERGDFNQEGDEDGLDPYKPRPEGGGNA
jgi:hypothetical protein